MVWNLNINGGGGCTNMVVEVTISVNTGGRAEVMLTQTLETGGGGLHQWSSKSGLDADNDREATMGSG